MWYNSISIPNQLPVLTPLPRAQACTEIILVYSGEMTDYFTPHVAHRPILTLRLEWASVCFEQMEMYGSEQTVRINKPPDLL